jgi:hypothetical protein
MCDIQKQTMGSIVDWYYILFDWSHTETMDSIVDWHYIQFDW